MFLLLTLILRLDNMYRSILSGVRNPGNRSGRVFALLLGLVLSMPVYQAQAALLGLSDYPLAISTSVNPNVMLLLDNSGSMDNIVWATAYNDTTVYADWSNGGGGWSNSTPGKPNNIELNDIDDCALIPDSSLAANTYDIQGNGRCLILPDPVGGGNTQYSANYLNYLFTTYTTANQDLSGGVLIPNKTRLTVMKQVSTNLVNSTSGIRYCLATFDSNDGARIEQQCTLDSSLITVGATAGSAAGTDGIEDLTAGGGTPLAESLYEITRYFRGLSKFHGSGVDFVSPIRYRCQKNFTIVVTDGLPTRENRFVSPTGDPDVDNGCATNANPCLPNWDDYPVLPTTLDQTNDFADGITPAGSDTYAEGVTLYLDDMAKFAYDIDLRNNSSGTGGLDDAGISFDTDPDYPKQNMETYTVGFTVASHMLADAAHYGAGLNRSDPHDTDSATKHYFTATDESTLLTQLTNAITNIEGKSSSAASVASNSGFVSSDNTAYIYQGKFESNYWTGNLQSYTVDPTTLALAALPSADAAEKLKTVLSTATGYTTRNIFSFKSGTGGIAFNWADLSTAQKTLLQDREEILNYIRGDQSCETNSTDTCPSGQTKDLRDRNTTGLGFLGSIVHSAPVYISAPRHGYPDVWPTGSAENGHPYSNFKTTHRRRKPVVYVGANDGMLHAFDAGVEDDPTTGTPALPNNEEVAPTLAEYFAYIPNSVYPNLAALGSSAYSHKYFVDGTPTVIDAFYSSDWHTVLVGGLNKGGQGVYALDVTDPVAAGGSVNFNASNVMWEFTDANHADLGYTYSQPSIVRLNSGVWAAVFGNGYNNTEDDTATGGVASTTGNAVLYVVNVQTGALIRAITTNTGTAEDPTGAGRANGLANAAVIDINNNFTADYVYAGDLFGNMWRFDLTSSNPANWRILGRGTSPTTSPIFVARDAGGTVQPITSRPEVSRTSGGGLMLHFGTGMYLQDTDKADTSEQTFYGLLDDPVGDTFAQDDGVPATTIPLQATRASMVGQSVLTEDTTTSTTGTRTFSSNATGTYRNWYLDLKSPAAPLARGERVVSSPLVRGTTRKRVIFVSIIPNNTTPPSVLNDPCVSSGYSWLNELDARNGNRTTEAVIDITGDGTPDKDASGIAYNAAGRSGIQTSPTIVTGKDSEAKFLSSSSGSVASIREAPPENSSGRQMWLQVK